MCIAKLLLLLAVFNLARAQSSGVNSTPFSTLMTEGGPNNDSTGILMDNDNDEQTSCQPLLASFQKDRGLKNGTQLSLLLALPLTYKGVPYLAPGFFQLASALMAIDHFNERHAAIVPELATLRDCPIQIDYESLHVMDTGTLEKNAMRTIMNILDDKQKEVPNAIVGPYNEIPATELSVAASTLQIPMVTHRGLDHNLLMPDKHPWVTQVNPDLYTDMALLGDYLQHVGRTDYIAVLYASSADSAIQRLEVFRGVAQALNMDHIQSFGYVSPATPVNSNLPTQNISTAMANLKASGYRTIVWLSPYFDDEAFLVGQAAHKYELDQGDHLWVIGAALEIDKPLDTPGTAENNNASSNGGLGGALEDWDESYMEDIEDIDPNDISGFDEIQFMRNAAFLRQAELMDVLNSNHSQFMTEWMQLNESFIERLLDLNPLESTAYDSEWLQYSIISPMLGWIESGDFPNGAFPPKDLFSKPVPFLSSPPSGAQNLYDAIMVIGIGACNAISGTINTTAQESTPGNITLTGAMMHEFIRKVHFQGASGEVRFGNGFPGSRMGSTVTYNAASLFPGGFSVPYAVSEVRNATDGKWYEVSPFIYRDGSTNPPALLRDPAKPSYLSDGVRAAGLALMSFALFDILWSFIWVVVHRHNSIVVASQPEFLYFICLGTTLTSLAILLLSFDESTGWSEDELTKACIGVPWLVVLGHIFTYNCLFSKLWRVNRVLQFSRRKVRLINVLWPAWLIELTAIVLLSVWTATTTYGWERQINEATGESMGKCTGDDEYAFWVPISILIMIPTILTGVMAYLTIDVDPAYSEAKWILALMLVQCQVIFVGVPMVFILQDVSTDGRYLGSCLILFTFPMTTLGLIFLPKMCAVHFPATGDHHGPRGSSGGVRVSGLEGAPNATQSDVSTLSREPAHCDSPSNLTQPSRISHVTVQ